MKPVDQTAFGAVGNCFSACIASILEISLDRVPWFMDETKGPWWQQFIAWCNENGVRATYYGNPTNVPSGFSIKTGRSPRNPERYHAVVALDGAMVHDPNPERTGILDVLDWVTVEWVVVS